MVTTRARAWRYLIDQVETPQCHEPCDPLLLLLRREDACVVEYVFRRTQSAFSIGATFEDHMRVKTLASSSLCLDLVTLLEAAATNLLC